MKKSMFICLVLTLVCMIGISSCIKSEKKKTPNVEAGAVEKVASAQLQTAMNVIGQFLLRSQMGVNWFRKE